MPKVLFATPNQSYYSETFVRDHIRLLKPDTVLYGGWKPYYSEDGKSIFQGIWKINLIRAGLKRLFPAWYSALYNHHLYKLIQLEKFDCILTEYGLTATSLLPAAKKSKIPLTCIFHGFDAYEHTYTRLYKERYTELFQYSPRIICVSNDMKNQLVTLGCGPDKISVIPCGVDPDIFTPNPLVIRKENQLLFIGRFTPKKNPIGLLSSFEQVLKSHPECTLVMAGDGELLNEARNFATQRGIINVRFPGKIDRAQALHLLNESTIYVQHSIRVETTGDSEGTPVSVLEAQAMKLPVVSTLHAGIKDAVIDGETGYLVAENDTKSFALKVIELLEKRELRHSFGENGRQHIIRNYTQDSLTAQIKDVIDYAIKSID